MRRDVIFLWVSLVLLGFALRVYRLGSPPMRWDEGWSLGLASLSWGEINRITALDVHPPFYYYLLKPWLALGKDEFWTRYLSVLSGTLAIPLIGAMGRAWCGRETGTLAAFYAAIAPILIYYAQVTRMFALAVALIALAGYVLLRALSDEELSHWLYFLLASAAALYTFYYTAFIVAAFLAYALIVARKRQGTLRRLSLAFGTLVVLYLPWLLYALGPMWHRVGRRTGFAFSPADAFVFFKEGIFALAFAYGTGWWAVHILLGLIGGGLLLAWRRKALGGELVLPLLALFLTLAGVSVGAKAHMFAARYLILASPFLALALARALEMLRRRSPALLALGLAVLVASILPSIAHYVYAKTYEVSEPFDPEAVYRFLQGKAHPEDVVFFNVLSLAGAYERYRTPQDAAWSYALSWDPVIEPLEQALGRIEEASRFHRRLWFVFYKGTVAANARLKEWLDCHLYPAFGQWDGDILYELYLSPANPLLAAGRQGRFEGGILLRRTAFTPSTGPGGEIGVLLAWQATEEVPADYKVFVHAYTLDGRLVAQHDAHPVNELRPTSGWRQGELVLDRHGLVLPPDAPPELLLAVGLYEPSTGRRLLLADGSDHLPIGKVQVRCMFSQ
jgi:hypothetical protein